MRREIGRLRNNSIYNLDVNWHVEAALTPGCGGRKTLREYYLLRVEVVSFHLEGCGAHLFHLSELMGHLPYLSRAHFVGLAQELSGVEDKIRLIYIHISIER